MLAALEKQLDRARAMNARLTHLEQDLRKLEYKAALERFTEVTEIERAAQQVLDALVVALDAIKVNNPPCADAIIKASIRVQQSVVQRLARHASVLAIHARNLLPD